VRDLLVMGHHDQHGHAELEFRDVRVPAGTLLAQEGDGFVIAQARLRALDMMVRRGRDRVAFGKPLVEQGLVQSAIAESRIAIDQARLLIMITAWMIDTVGAREARGDIAAIKVIAPRVACDVIDRAIQVHGGLGISDDTVLPRLYGWHRAMRLFDGPDEVHLRTVAKVEIDRH